MKIHQLVTAALILNSSAMLLCGEVIYNSIPNPIPPNVASHAFQARSTREFGNAVTLAPGDRNLRGITVLMSSWALHSTYSEMSPEGFDVPMTMSLYEYGPAGAVGDKIAEVNIDALIPWRPEASGNCSSGRWLASDGACYNGIAAPIDFDFSSQHIVLPDTFIFGIAFNTQSYGADPIGEPGPYNSLNVGVQGSPTVGADTDPGHPYVNSSWQGAYGDNGPTGVFRKANLSQQTVNVRIETVPEPSALTLAGGALMLLMAARIVNRFRRRNGRGSVTH
jgi:hypothetical protein